MMTDKEQQEQITQIPYRPKKGRVKKVEGGFLNNFSLTLVVVMIFCVFLYRGEILNGIKDIISPAKAPKEASLEFKLPFGAKRHNILLMGVDAGENKDRPFDSTRTDSIYLLSIAPREKSVNIISIPRDSKVYIHSKSHPDKINHAFAYGGAEETIKTVEQTLGVRINHYIAVSNMAVGEFIDKIGGLDIYVEKNMYYNDNTANLHINLDKGLHHLDGKSAEGYLRYRKDGLGDIGRIKRQQWFLAALNQKFKDPSIVIKIPDIVKSLSKYIQTDLSMYEIAQYAAFAKTVSPDKIVVATLPGEPSQRGFVSYWILDPDMVQDMVNKLVYGQKPEKMTRPLEIGIIYPMEKGQIAKQLQQELENQGYHVNLRESSIHSHPHIAIHNTDISLETINGIKGLVPDLKNMQTEWDIIGISKAARDFTIILSGS